MINNPFSILCFSLLLICSGLAMAQEMEQAEPLKDEDCLVIVWTSGDPEVAEKMLFMYAHAASHYGWFEQVTIIVWGPSARLLAAHKDLQEKVKQMQAGGVVFEACVACAGQYGVVEDLEKLGIDVKGMGVPLTEYIKSGKHVVTF